MSRRNTQRLRTYQEQRALNEATDRELKDQLERFVAALKEVQEKALTDKAALHRFRGIVYSHLSANEQRRLEDAAGNPQV
jgi:cytoplasmic iron level regulating protein YaaA (DUF328/UPF0246 family)